MQVSARGGSVDDDDDDDDDEAVVVGIVRDILIPVRNALCLEC